jgi:predicted nuclease of predicted toxin-antitoxin system
VRLLVDECCDEQVAAGLRADGHDVSSVRESAPGSDDTTVLQAAVAEQRLLLTEDKDFGELVVRLGLPAYGIILVRMSDPHGEVKLERLREVLANHGDRLAGSVVVVEAERVRFRPLYRPPNAG